MTSLDIQLECPKCGLKTSTPRIDEDPPEAFKAEIICPECSGGDFGLTTYYDRHGIEVAQKWKSAHD